MRANESALRIRPDCRLWKIGESPVECVQCREAGFGQSSSMARGKIVEINQLVLLAHTVPILEINNEGRKRVRNNWLAHGCLLSYLGRLDPILFSEV
jgi:hypothetical protein